MRQILHWQIIYDLRQIIYDLRPMYNVPHGLAYYAQTQKVLVLYLENIL